MSINVSCMTCMNDLELIVILMCSIIWKSIFFVIVLLLLVSIFSGRVGSLNIHPNLKLQTAFVKSHVWWVPFCWNIQHMFVSIWGSVCSLAEIYCIFGKLYPLSMIVNYKECTFAVHVEKYRWTCRLKVLWF